ncbi:MAG: hypothetical protein ACYS80_17680 [Planctomycetota bacterium]|jgi:hypothetical protein
MEAAKKQSQFKAKQSQFISYCVLRDAYCENESEKTKTNVGLWPEILKQDEWMTNDRA